MLMLDMGNPSTARRLAGGYMLWFLGFGTFIR